MSLLGILETGRLDPLMREVPLSFTAMFYPAGFPLLLHTNSRDVMEAAQESWSEWQPAFDREPIVLRVLVEHEGDLASPPRYRMLDHLIQIVSDANNFAVADCRALSASICVSEKTAADHGYLRWFFVESMAYLLLDQRYLTAVHAACVARDGKGSLLFGLSGAGKSTLAFACARAGFTYIADDCAWLVTGAANRSVIGRPQQIRFRDDVANHFPELAGRMAGVRPNGKISIEVRMRDLPGIAIASSCTTANLVFLDRESQSPARLESVPRDQALEWILRDMPSYGEAVNCIHQETVEKLAEAPAFRLHYRSLEDGIRLLSELS